MPGMGGVHFPITTRHPLGQKFFDQGIGQLHGFFYFEAERSFRQVAALDPGCPMAFWGMAMANLNNAKRAKEFIKSAEKLKGAATGREQKWINALADYYRDEKKDEKERRKTYNQALERIVKDHPEDVEAKALLAVQLWQSSSKGVPYGDKKVVDALLDAVLAANRFHPANHYRIHLWDEGARATNALVSAANCGPSAPGIAHMWHMSGHTYSALKRYSDAAWQQEASARVDHAYMMSNRVLPDQIHNFAHNNEWLIRDLNNIGAVRRAVELGRNMIELPRHPKFNTLSKGSAAYGYQRLLETLTRYELWEELTALAGSVYLDPTDNNDHQARRLHALGLAALHTGDLAGGRKQIAALESLAVKVASKPAPTNTPAIKPTTAGRPGGTNAVTTPKPGMGTNTVAAIKATGATNAPPVAKAMPTPGSNSVASVSVRTVTGATTAPATAPAVKPDTAGTPKGTNSAIAAKPPVTTNSVAATGATRTTNAPASAKTAPPPGTNAVASATVRPNSGTNATPAGATASKESSKPAPKRPAGGGYAGGATLLATGNTNSIGAAVAELRCLLAVKEGALAAAKEQLAKLKEVPKDRFARLHFTVGETNRAEEIAAEAAKTAEGMVQPLASHVDILWQNGRHADAFAAFFRLRELAAEADLTAPAFRRLAPVAKALAFEADWRPPLSRAEDFGPRPALDSLGPFRWQPSAAPDWTLPDGEGRQFTLRQFRGRPVVVIFYLGAGCAHCIEQLVAFAPMADEFKAAGITLVAVSTDSVSGLKETVEKAKYNGGFPIPLLSDDSLATFKAYRAHDDFEAKPLHGTFLLDGEGRIRWQDISYQPFMETKFLLTEARRLLALPQEHSTAARPATGKRPGGTGGQVN